MPACPDDALPIDFFSPARRVLPHNYVAVALAVAAFVWPASAQAACWFDAALTQQARQIAQRLMPELQTVPEVSVCTPEHFPARVDGLFQGGANQIFIHQTAVGPRKTADLLIHELAHALIYQQFGPQNFAGGHSPAWMRLMVRLGRIDDARFHASVYPEALPGFQQALAERTRDEPWGGGGRPPASPPTALAAAQADLRGLNCARVLLVPPQGGAVVYDLPPTVVRSLTLLPFGNDRVRSIRWTSAQQIEVVARPSDDGTATLVCLG